MQSNFNLKVKEFILWLLIGMATLGSFFLTYGYHLSTPMIAVVWIVWLCVAGALAFYTVPGQRVYSFSKEAKIELQKVVWSSRQETVQTTMIVMAVVAATGLMLWLFDVVILWGIAKLTHLG